MELLGFVGFGAILVGLAWFLNRHREGAERNHLDYRGP
jgi:hypothetical protein